MFDLVAVGLTQGAIDFITTIVTLGEYNKSYDFNLGTTRDNVNFNTKLDMEKRNLHMTIDIDINF